MVSLTCLVCGGEMALFLEGSGFMRSAEWGPYLALSWGRDPFSSLQSRLLVRICSARAVFFHLVYSGAGLKAGAKTGLSVVACGCLFLLSVVLCPLLASAPATGTAPVLLMIGTIEIYTET